MIIRMMAFIFIALSLRSFRNMYHHLLTQRTARYFTLGEISKNTKTVWLACHGYGQLAGEFIKELKPLAEKSGGAEDGGHGTNDILIVAPEALSRFYTKGFFGAVGASWMTREDRESEIDDYVHYLQKLFETIKSQVHPDAVFHLMGFSQGCSTICRWVAWKAPPVDSLWLCSGNIPDDLDFEKFRSAIKNYPVYLLVGDEDPFIAEKDREETLQRIREHRLPVNVQPFNGGHDLNLTLVQSLL